jgi:ribosomal protein S18 acetylase RimI-like enzyme
MGSSLSGHDERRASLQENGSTPAPVAYRLRPATSDDAEFLFQVYASTRAEELAVVPWTAEQKEGFLRMQFAAQDAHYRTHYVDASFDVIRVGADLAGRLYVYRTPREIRVMDIALLPAFRGQGIGERVLRDLFAEADREERRMSIHVEHMNPARRLYERVGFHVVDDGEENPVYLLMERPPATTAR